jgi:penicillin-binding protein 1A
MKRSSRIAIEILLGVCIVAAVGLGIGLGIALAATRNLEITENIGERQLALPSQILDRNDRLITEYFSDEKRDIAAIDTLPPHLVYALITAEDRNFFKHRGIDLLGTLRAQWNNMFGTYFSGASSISQQVAGELYTDRTVISYKRKLIELWYAFQMERHLTKYQILELYMNTVYLGHNTHGVEAASQFYFGKSAQDINLAEAAILVVQIRSPARYSMINHPNDARDRQRSLLDDMVDLEYVTREKADLSLESFWESYDTTRSNQATAYFANESRAPYFTEYVRLQLEEILYGPLIDVNREGLIIHTTLDLDIQDTAQEQMSAGIHTIDTKYQTERKERIEAADDYYMPVIHAAALLFDMEQINLSGVKLERDSDTLFHEKINPVLDALSLMFDDKDIRSFVYRAYDYWENRVKKTTVEGALITLENGTGHILAMVGGSEFKTKKYNRAVDATIQPGSSFKPLYYSAAISTRTFTPASMIVDQPVVFFNADGEKYEPTNYLGEWRGPVRLRIALANSMNVPSVKVLDAIGFDTAIERASRLLGMYELRNNENLFPRKYPLALGVVSVAPINMARAYSVFANQGRVIEPIAIRYIEDRKGNIIREYEKEVIKERGRRSEEELQILTPQEAYIMVSILQSVVAEGTLRWRRVNIGGFDGMPMAGKTGTNTNWADAWTVGFSPYYTTAVWFGFDLPGESLGRNQTGATAAGPIWARYMKDIHADLPRKGFVVPDSGIITRTVCAVSGLLPTDECNEGIIDEIFLAGSEPDTPCDVHPFRVDRDDELQTKLKERLLTIDIDTPGFRLPEYDFELIHAEDASESRDPIRNSGSKSRNPLLD